MHPGCHVSDEPTYLQAASDCPLSLQGEGWGEGTDSTQKPTLPASTIREQARSYTHIGNIAVSRPKAAAYPAPVTAGAVTGFGDPRK